MRDDIALEAVIVFQTQKAVLVEPTVFGPDQLWIPKSAITEWGERDMEGRRLLEFAKWWTRSPKEGWEWLNA